MRLSRAMVAFLVLVAVSSCEGEGPEGPAFAPDGGPGWGEGRPDTAGPSDSGALVVPDAVDPLDVVLGGVDTAPGVDLPSRPDLPAPDDLSAIPELPAGDDAHLAEDLPSLRPDVGPDDPCPSGVVCVTRFPFTHRGTTTGSPFDAFDRYGCDPGVNESGPEVLYRVDLPDEGFLALDLPANRMPDEVDVDVHLLASLDPEDCLDRGHWRAGALLGAGRYWVVADSWVGGDGTVYDGAYTLTFGFTSAAHMAATGLDRRVAEDALHAFDVAWSGLQAEHFSLAVADFSLHSALPREWIWDLSSGALRWNLYVTHGEASADAMDPGLAVVFSNVPGSHQSSLGLYRVAETYSGDYGHSARLDGLEPGFNDNARARAVVLHGWTYARPEYVDELGYLPNSWGCPAIDDRIATPVVDFMAEGGILLLHYPDGDWSARSTYLP